MLRLIALLSFVCMITACSTPKYALTDLPEEQLHFTFGGGFTGEFKDYMLLKNGQIFKRTRVIRPTSFTPLEPLSKKEAKELFKTYEKQNFAALNFNDPGNMTYSIKMISKTDTTEVVWGGVESEPTIELKSYWRRLIKFVTDRPELKSDDKEAKM